MRPQLKTRSGYDFYEVASALQKSIRRGETEVAGYFALEMFPDYHNYVWKRLLTVSAEDCYGVITKEIYALYESFLMVNRGKKDRNKGGRIFISKAVILLCAVKKNRDADILSNYVYDKKATLTDEEIESWIDEVRKEYKSIPEYVYDVHTLKGKMMGKTKKDFFLQEQREMTNQQQSMFDVEKLLNEN